MEEPEDGLGNSGNYSPVSKTETAERESGSVEQMSVVPEPFESTHSEYAEQWLSVLDSESAEHWLSLSDSDSTERWLSLSDSDSFERCSYVPGSERVAGLLPESAGRAESQCCDAG